LELELEIKKIAFGGDGIAAVNGKTCFVEGSLPDEKVLVKVVQDKKNFLRAKLVKVLTPSPHRIEPPCPYVSHCGGCQYQHISYEEELRIKETQAREILSRGAGVAGELVKPICAAEKDFGYRNSITLHLSKSAGLKKKPVIGFIGRDNESIIPIQNCLIADPRFLPVFQANIKLKGRKDKITFKLSDKGEIISDETKKFFRIKIGKETLLTSSEGFFQNNLPMTELLTGRVSEWIKALRPKSFFDLFSGVGTFSFLCAKDVEEIYCIEDNVPSLEALKMNKEEKHLSQMKILAGSVEKTFPKIWEEKKGNHSIVLLDPPRQGLEAGFARYLSSRNDIDHLIYVSCDPATCARDLKIILEKENFKVKEIIPFDMFPKTKHIELLVLLEAKSAYIV